MERVKVIVDAHPDALYLLRAQGLVALAGALFLLGLLGLIFQATRRRRDFVARSDLPWVVIGGAVAIFLVFEGVWSLTRDAARIVLDGDRLQVGAEALVLDGTVLLTTRGRPGAPDPGLRGYARMPGAHSFPPFFTGGPLVTVRTAAGAVGFDPILYGPSGYFPDNPDPAADRLLRALVDRSAGGNARAWLDGVAAREPGAPAAVRPAYDLGTFLVWYLVIAVPVLGFLAVANAVLLRSPAPRS